MSLTTRDILDALPGAEMSGPSEPRVFERMVTDSRDDCTRGLFVALSGENFDGNRFLAAAANAGALGALAGPQGDSPAPPDSLQCFRVADSLAALQSLALWHRRRIVGCRAVGVTGSNGKSTTKQMIAAVLGRKYRTQATAGNRNNHIGVPLTLLALQPGTQVLVAEMGANHPGEIRALARLVEPEIAVVTNISPAHLEGFGSLEGVLDTKLELFEETKADGLRLYNSDDPLLGFEVPRRFHRVQSFGLGENAGTRATDIDLDSRACAVFTLDRATRVQLNIPGRHNVMNALAAAAVGKAMGLSAAEIRHGLQQAEPLGLRMDLRELGRVKLLNDCYNANPRSMVEALNTLEMIEHSGRRLAALGEMLELGQQAGALHAEIAREVAARRVDLVLFVGTFAGSMREEYIRSGGNPGRVLAADNSGEAWSLLKDIIRPGDLVLLKASRGVHLETVAREMEKELG